MYTLITMQHIVTTATLTPNNPTTFTETRKNVHTVG